MELLPLMSCSKLAASLLATIVVCCCLAASPSRASLPEIIKIGGMFETGDEMLELAFRFAVDRINDDPTILPKSRLSAQVARLEKHDSFQASKKVCELLAEGTAAILGPQTPESSAAALSTCAWLEVPFLSARWDPRPSLSLNHSAVNLYPSAVALSRAFRDYVLQKEWKIVAVLYEDNEALLRLQMLLKSPEIKGVRIVVYQFDPGDGGDYRKLLKKLHKEPFKNFLVDIPTERIPTFIQDARKMEMFTEYYNYVFTSLDMHTINMEEFYNLNVNITAFRLVETQSPEFEALKEAWEKGPMAFSAGMAGSADTQLAKTEVALVYDAVRLLAANLHTLGEERNLDRVPPLSCNNERPWAEGRAIASYLRSSIMTGLTGMVKFDADGQRSNFNLKIVDITYEGLTEVADWNPRSGFIDTANASKVAERAKESLRNRTLIITMKDTPPYVMLVKQKEGEPPLEGNARFEGFCIDLINEIAAELHFIPKFKLVDDGNHGSIINELGDWNGMIQELRTGKADAAIGDLTITHVRAKVVDFTMPFMNLGISILFKKMVKEDPVLFSFMLPFSLEVWLYIVTSLLGISMLLYTLARFTPYEWENPHPCDLNPEELENQFDLKNTFWFTVGCLMQAGSDPMPKAISTRIIASMWWFFTLIMVSSYTANLAAFLTSQRMGTVIESAEDLAKQTKIQYGCMEGGSTYSFFKESNYSTYKKMWSFMESTRPKVFTESNEKGVERVKKGNYAFLMESSTIRYRVERDCDLVEVGTPLDSKGYGIATPKGSPYVSHLSSMVIQMEEKGRLRALRDRWWKEMYVGEPCPVEDTKSMAAAELSMKHVGGVFLVLFLTNILAIIFLVLEFYWNFRQQPTDQKKNFIAELCREFARVVCGAGSTRPAPKEDEDDEESPPDSRRS